MKKLFKTLIIAVSLGMTSLFGTLVPAMAYTPTETYAATTKKESTYSITPSVTLKKGEEKTVGGHRPVPSSFPQYDFLVVF